MKCDDLDYDATFMEQMRDVLHHVADEETIILPLAEKLLADELGSLALTMTRRRLERLAPRSVELVGNLVRGLPASSILMAAVHFWPALIWSARSATGNNTEPEPQVSNTSESRKR